MAQDLMSQNFKSQIDSIEAATEARSKRVGDGPGKVAPREISVKTDPKIGEIIEGVREQGGTVKLNPDGSVADDEPQFAPQLPPSEATVDVAKQLEPDEEDDETPVDVLTDAQIIEKVRPFVDANVLRPVFISTPIQGRVYVGIYPSYGEQLAAERMLCRSVKSDSVSGFEFDILAELGASIRGFLFENDPAIVNIVAQPGNYAKWPKLHATQFLTAINPQVRQVVIPELTMQYVAWKKRVTPTDEELGKYYGLNASG